MVWKKEDIVREVLIRRKIEMETPALEEGIYKEEVFKTDWEVSQLMRYCTGQ